MPSVNPSTASSPVVTGAKNSLIDLKDFIAKTAKKVDLLVISIILLVVALPSITLGILGLTHTVTFIGLTTAKTLYFSGMATCALSVLLSLIGKRQAMNKAKEAREDLSVLRQLAEAHERIFLGGKK